MLDWICEFIWDFELFGITPFRGILSLVGSENFLAIIIGFSIICFIIKKMFGKNAIILPIKLLKLSFKTCYKLAKIIVLAVGDLYMFILLSKDSKAKNYEYAEFWEKRTLTNKGIVSVDITGAQPLLIKHPKFIGKTIEVAVSIHRVTSNILLVIKGIIGRA